MHKSRSPAAVIVCLIVGLLLFAAYVGSYVLLVDPPGSIISSQAGASPYRWGGAHAEWFYWPLEQVDRQVRPGLWALT